MLLTRAPLYRGRSPFSCDLHVLGAPLTFVLSQDQTLQLNLVSPRGACPARRRQSSGSGFWKLESHFGLAPADAAERTSRSPRTHSSSPCGLADEPWPQSAKASVRFSFQGPREPVAPESGGETVGEDFGSVKGAVRFFFADSFSCRPPGSRRGSSAGPHSRLATRERVVRPQLVPRRGPARRTALCEEATMPWPRLRSEVAWSCPQLLLRKSGVTPPLVRRGGTPLRRSGGAQ